MKTLAGMMAVVTGLMLVSDRIGAQQAPALAFGFGQFQHTVLDNDRSDFFYADAFGMTIRQVPGNPYGALPGDGTLTDTPARSRLIRSGGLFGMAGTPGGLSMEFVHFTNIAAMPGGARLQDPGNAVLMLTMPGVESVADKVRMAGGTTVTGSPMLTATGAKASALVRDPDGFLVFVAEGATVSARVALVVEDIDRAATFYRNLGLAVAPATGFSVDTGRLRVMTANGVNAPVQLLLFEFQGVDRRPLRKRLSDYGTPAMALTVRDCDAAAAVVKRSGGSVYSAGGECIHQTQANGMPFNRAFVRDADGFLLEFLQRGTPTP